MESPTPIYTEKELAEMKAKQILYYKESIKDLEVLLKFEKLKADIEEQRTRNLVYVLKRAEYSQVESPKQPLSETKTNSL